MKRDCKCNHFPMFETLPVRRSGGVLSYLPRYRSHGLPVCRLYRFAAFAGLPVCRSAGLPVDRSAGLPTCRSTGLPGLQVRPYAAVPVCLSAASTGSPLLPACRSAGPLVYRSTGPPVANLPVCRPPGLLGRQSAALTRLPV